MERTFMDVGAGPVLRIARGAHVMELAPHAGGRILRFSTAGADGRPRDWLKPITEAGWMSDAWPKGGCYPLVPFSNRVRGARFTAPDGTPVALSTFPGAAHALHGFGQYAPWQVEAHRDDALVMSYLHEEGGEGWPWAFEARQTIEMTESGARLKMRIANRSPHAMPVGFGFHPYFSAEEAELVAAVDWRHEAEIAIEPSGVPPPRHHARDAAGYTRYLSGWSGRAALRYTDGRTLELSAQAPLDHVVVHCPAGAGYLCVEPVSHVSDGFNLLAQGLPGTGVIVMEPDSERAASLEWAAGAMPGGGDGA
jgi:aldose 1-epimerase